MLRSLACILVLLAGACDDDTGGPLDLSVTDMAAPPGSDLATLDGHAPDMTCVFGQFNGFNGLSATERRFDCPCGCMVDSFNAPGVTGFWGQVATPGAQFDPMPSTGLGFDLQEPAAGGQVFAALNSDSTYPFFLDGDFDLLVDYAITGTLPLDAHIELEVQRPMASATIDYTVERERGTDGSDGYVARLGGVQPRTVATGLQQGTLELARTGLTIVATADGTEITRLVNAANGDRLRIVLTGSMSDCHRVGDGGVPGDGGASDDGGAQGSCGFSVSWHDLRLAQGSLVDRK